MKRYSVYLAKDGTQPVDLEGRRFSQFWFSQCYNNDEYFE